MKYVIGFSCLVLVATISGACGDDEPSTTGDPGGIGGAGGAGGNAVVPWNSNTCGTCVATECTVPLAACAGDPDCADWLECANACPAAEPDGDADPACEDACPISDSTAAEKARDNVLYCKRVGAGAEVCPTCGHIKAENPWLNQTCSGSMDPNPCYACEDTNCCESYVQYAANPEAVIIKDCILACPVDDDDCSYQCLLDHPDGVEDWGIRVGCLATYCFDDDACGEVPLDACVECANQNCADVMMACNEDPECFLIAECIGRSTCVGDCIQQCINDHPTAEDTFIQYSICAVNECGEVCG